MSKFPKPRRILEFCLAIFVFFCLGRYFTKKSELPKDFWLQVQNANFANGSSRVLDKFCDSECVYVVDVFINGPEKHVMRAVTKEEEYIGSFVALSILKIDENDIDTSKWKVDHGLAAPNSIHAAQLNLLFKSGVIPLSQNLEGHTLIFGVATGGTYMFLQNLFPKMTITGLEISKQNIEIGKKWFGFKINDQNEFLESNVLDYVKTSIDEKHRPNLVLVDACVDFDCPPKSLLSDEFIKNLREIMKSDGVLSMNILTARDDFKEVYQYVKDKFSMHFDACDYTQLSGYRNAIMTCYCSKKSYQPRKNTSKFLKHIGIMNNFY
ncbi:unnamed protein product [Caenorhabditis angaria]|uniref:Methyltransferase domain-containing protein n=1 Tax=Caenorhabditis angaria TaxID=860376 RepID=A0A9P1IRU2_9PELO|nr:unnamed protein product [Caenorhabditis angaria]